MSNFSEVVVASVNKKSYNILTFNLKSLSFGFQHLKETHPLLLKTQTSLEETIQNSKADYYNVEKTNSEADLKYVVQFD